MKVIKGFIFYDCRCQCGVERTIRVHGLVLGKTKSCGCYKRDNPGSRTHGMTNSREFEIWSGIKKRCCNPKTRSYRIYGGRGIAICDRWRDSFEAFFADMGPSPSEAYSIDRINADGNYEPSNCRWATSAEQGANRRNLKMLTYDRQTKPLSQWARDLGVPIWRIAGPINQGKKDPAHVLKRLHDKPACTSM